MWTNAYKKILQARAQRTVGATPGGVPNVRAMNNTTYDIATNSATRNMIDALSNADIYPTSYARTSTNYASHIVFGTGSTAESADDYKLDSIYTSVQPVGVVNPNFTQNADGSFTARLEKMCVNSGADAVTISEWGIVIWGMDNVSTTYKVPILAYREVLDTPVLVGPGKVFTFAVTVTVPSIEE